MANRSLERHRDLTQKAQERLEVKRQIQEGIDSGMHLFDAAEAMGIPVDLVIANVSSDPDFRTWYEASRNRMRITTYETPDALDQEGMKDAILRAAFRAGAPEKIATIIALADPHTPEGKKDLKDFGMAILKDHLPKQKNVKTRDESKTLTADAVIEEMGAAGREIADMQKRVAAAEAVYLEDSLGPGSPQADGDADSLEEDQGGGAIPDAGADPATG